MSYAQHASARGRKTHSGSASYCRHADWWKQPESQSGETDSPTKYSYRKPSYAKRRKGKNWSIVVLSSNIDELRKAINKSRAEDLEPEFIRLVKQWQEETFPISSLTKIYGHRAYQRIMAMGTDGIPLVLKELQKNQGQWFYALRFMAGENVSEGMNNYEDAKAAWLEWGDKHHYI